MSRRSRPRLSPEACKEEEEGRHQDEEIQELLFKQAIVANLAVKDKDDEWRRVREEQKNMYIDLVNSDEED